MAAVEKADRRVWVATRPSSLRVRRRKAVSVIPFPGSGHSTLSLFNTELPDDDYKATGRLCRTSRHGIFACRNPARNCPSTIGNVSSLPSVLRLAAHPEQEALPEWSSHPLVFPPQPPL